MPPKRKEVKEQKPPTPQLERLTFDLTDKQADIILNSQQSIEIAKLQLKSAEEKRDIALGIVLAGFDYPKEARFERLTKDPPTIVMILPPKD